MTVDDQDRLIDEAQRLCRRLAWSRAGNPYDARVQHARLVLERAMARVARRVAKWADDWERSRS